MTKVEYMELFETITDQLLEIDQNASSEELIRKVEDLLSKRDKIIDEVNGLEDKTPLEEALHLRLLQKNNQLETILGEITFGIEDKITGVKKEKSLSSKKKKAHRGYLNMGYQNDGYFIDKKK